MYNDDVLDLIYQERVKMIQNLYSIKKAMNEVAKLANQQTQKIAEQKIIIDKQLQAINKANKPKDHFDPIKIVE